LNEKQARRIDMRDIVGLLGVVLITGGVVMVNLPAALIVCGSLLLTGAILAARRA
jgi:hypothetical protein